jgi:hypothetical protein
MKVCELDGTVRELVVSKGELVVTLRDRVQVWMRMW